MGKKIQLYTLVIRQPWAGLIMVGKKPIEYRSWQTSYRGPFLIAAGARKPTADVLEDEIRSNRLLAGMMKRRPCFALGAIVGIARLHRIDGEPGDFEWRVTCPAALLEPIPHKGKLQLYRTEIDADTPLHHAKYETIRDYVHAFSKDMK